MNIKKLLKVILIITLIIMTFDCTYKFVSAQATINMYNGEANNTETGEGISAARKIIGRIITIIQIVGTFVAVAMSMALGIKYIVASPGDRAEIKQHLTTYLIGAIVFFSSIGILTILKRFFTKL